ncbi:MAG: CHRD domain-containing protein [Bryobacter sp.]|nr:CHRD domain-containing protein [Bryobacter sp.]
MKTLSLLVPLMGLAALAPAQTTQSIPFRLELSPLNEVPALTELNASGAATVWLHVVRDAQGAIVRGSVDFTIRYRFPGETTFTGLHIHRGLAGTNGPVLIDTGLNANAPVVDAQGRGEIFRQVPILPGTPNVAVLAGILENPETFYVNLHTSVNRGGAIRGQLQRTEYRVFGADLSPANEVPALTNSQARGYGFVTLLAGVNSQGALQSSEVNFLVDYTGFAEDTQFTGMHIHRGRRGANGPVTIDTGLNAAQNILTGAGGAGRLSYTVDLNMQNNNSIDTVYQMLQDPSGAYLNVHTARNRGGEIRAQLRSTELLSFQTPAMSPLNEVPALTELQASGSGAFNVSLLRAPSGAAQAALLTFDVNHAFPADTTFTGLHIHEGASGANGPVVLDSGINAASNLVSATGRGNIYRQAFATTEAQRGALDRLFANPRNFYINLHTSVNRGGAVRQQLRDAALAPPRLDNVIQSVSDPTRTTLAQGGLMTLYGANLGASTASLNGWEGAQAPTSLNGTSVMIDGRPAPVLEVLPGSIIAQVPFETSAQMVNLSVITSAGPSNAFAVRVAATAPSIFFDQINPSGNRALTLNMADNNQMTQDNPAAEGMTLAVFGTGFGQSTPALATGEVAGAQVLARFPEVKVTVGGREATDVVTVLVPGLVGITQTIFRAPAGTGATPMEVEFRGAKSNPTILFMR